VFRTQRQLSGYATAKTLPTFPHGSNGPFSRTLPIWHPLAPEFGIRNSEFGIAAHPASPFGLRRDKPTPAEFRISNFEFRIFHPATPAFTLHPEPTVGGPLLRRASSRGRVWQGARHSSGMGNLGVLVTHSASSTVDAPQSASNAIYHSYSSERRGGRSPTWLSEGGWAGGGGGEKEFEGVPPLECSPPARRRRARSRTGGTEERVRSEGAPVSDRGRGR